MEVVDGEKAPSSTSAGIFVVNELSKIDGGCPIESETYLTQCRFYKYVTCEMENTEDSQIVAKYVPPYPPPSLRFK